MPKIAYEIGIDPQRKVTKEWIQEKLNSAKALMQGRIDEENLCADNTEQLMKTIKDRPTEVVAYDNCMKFFQRVGTPEEQSLGDHTPVVDLFAMLVNLCKASPDVAVVGGTLDSEMSVTFTIEKGVTNSDDNGAGATSETRIMKKEFEIPSNYYPMTWGELADIMVASGFIPKTIAIDQETGELSLVDTAEVNKDSSDKEKKDYILKEFNLDTNNYVETVGYFRDGSCLKTNGNVVQNSDDTTVWGNDFQENIIQIDLIFQKPILYENFIRYEMVASFDVSAKPQRSDPDKDSNIVPPWDFGDNKKYIPKYLNESGFASVKLVPEILCKVV